MVARKREPEGDSPEDSEVVSEKDNSSERPEGDAPDEEESSIEDILEESDVLLEEEENRANIPLRATGLIPKSEEDSWEAKNLEDSLAGVPLNKWEEHHSDSSEDNLYSENTEEQNGESQKDARNYSGIGFNTGLGEDEPKMYILGAEEESRRFYDPRVEELNSKEEVRQADQPKLKIVGLQAGFGVVPGRKRKSKHNKKYRVG